MNKSPATTRELVKIFADKSACHKIPRNYLYLQPIMISLGQPPPFPLSSDGFAIGVGRKEEGER
jgi:hypothetical protein